jgi:hypothetical protein
MKNAVVFFVFALVTSLRAYPQVSVNTDNSLPDNSAMIDVKSEARGFLLPRMTQAQRDAIATPAEGLMVLCTDCDLIDHKMISIYINGTWRLLTGYCTAPAAPAAAPQNASQTQIIWNWNAVSGATGYKWNTVNNPSTAADMWTDHLTKTETGLTCNMAYTRYAWAYNNCGYSTVLIMNQTTFVCGLHAEEH